MLQPTEHVIDLVDDYLHDLLAPADAGVVDEHCHRCPICRVALEEARKRQALFPALLAPPAPPLLLERAVGNVQAVSGGKATLRNRITFSTAYLVAAAVLVLATIHVFVYRLSPSPYDLRVLGQSELLVDSPAALRLAVFNRRSGDLVPDVPVELTLVNPATRERNWLANINTSTLNAATTHFRLPKWPPGPYQLEVVARTSDGLEVIRRHVQLKETWNVHLTADKPVYQPGQTIQLRALSLRQPELHPLVGEKVEFAIADPRGNVIYRTQDVTSKFGLATANCPLADELNEGPYRIDCRVGGASVSRVVEVHTYALPKFKVTVELDRPFYAPGDKVSGKVQAQYFFGRPIAGGAVEIQALLTQAPGEELASVLANTDDSGQAAFEFTLPPELPGAARASGQAPFRVAARITDPAGQSQTGAAARVVTTQPLVLDVLPENGALVRGVPNQVYVLARYADGRPAKVRLHVSEVREDLSTNELGAAVFVITPTTDAVSLTVKATAANGLEARRQIELVCGVASDDFLVRTDKAVYEGGEPIALTALGGGLEPVYVDLLQDGQTVLTEVLEPAQGQATERISLPETVFGTLELVAYRFNAAGEEVRKTRLLHVRPARQIAISATLAKDEFRPGEKTPLRISLSDAQGNPVVGAVSLAAVDDAVYAVLKPRGALDSSFFLLERQMLAPVDAVYDDWRPTPKPTAGKQLLDQAVFAAAASASAGAELLPGDFTGLPAAAAALPSAVHAGNANAAERLERLPGLSGSSYPEKEERVERERQQGLQQLYLAWGALLGLVLVLSAVYFVMFVRPSPLQALAGTALCAFIAGGAILLFARGGAPHKAAARSLLRPDEKKIDSSAHDNRPRTIAAAAAPVRTRDDFPETLLWRPEVITDPSGAATVELQMADSITTWRLSASAVSEQGRLGVGEWPIKVFQSFFVDVNLPATLTRNDELDLPVVLYNYLDRPQRVKLSVGAEKWFEFRGPSEPGVPGTYTLDLAANEVRSVPVPLKVLSAGAQKLYVSAQGTDASDRLERAVEVLPDGRRVELVAGGTLEQPAEHTFELPEHRIEGSTRCLVKLYPSTLSQVLDGLDGIFRMPSGCFEQTSSTLYPNILALEYLQRTKTSSPAQAAKARQYIHIGYQRLLAFEVPGGGFEWFGRAPAHVGLTAYGLNELEDLAQLYDVDPALLARTRHWLLNQRLPNGAWSGERSTRPASALAAGARPDKGHLATTAYVAAALFRHGQAEAAAPLTLSYLLAQSEKLDDPYTLALVVRAVATIDPNYEKLKDLADRLDHLKKSDATGRLVWWELPQGNTTLFYGSGASGNIEATANAMLALVAADRGSASVRSAAAWLAAQRDARGTWNSSQATVMALKALLAVSGKALPDGKSRRAEIAVNEAARSNVVIDASQDDVVRTIDLTPEARSGPMHVTITDLSKTAMGYQLIVRYHVPASTSPPVEEEPQRAPLAMELEYDRQEVPVNQEVNVVARVTNQREQPALMAIVDLPIPPGFTLQSEVLDELVAAKTIERYQVTPRKAMLYFRELKPRSPVEIHYRLVAAFAAKVQAPGAQAYLYYDPDVRAVSPGVVLEATQASRE